MIQARGTGCGKAIVLGEHAVVHGQPELVMALDLQVEVQLSAGPGAHPGSGTAGGVQKAILAAGRALRPVGLRVDVRELGVSVAGNVPVGMGLGSSAALAVALVRALMSLEDIPGDDRSVAAAANEVEKEFHGTPSGIDACAAAVGGLLCFRAGAPPRWEAVLSRGALPLVVALSGEAHQTGQAVGALGERARRSPELYQPIFSEIGELALSGRKAVEAGSWEVLGPIMSSNHSLLQRCGVSTDALDRLVRDALELGALGAKLTGAGGGGAIVALAAGDPAPLVQGLRARGWEAFAAGAESTRLDQGGRP